ncbi:piggyBac transposable element-derived protein 4-like [Ruditapes philippinarum]|uniref:piggyBac transposable element-derived protein 4-like n=1 Tax=Ruditapes philippinarum TaxID=129788 RepID=UPI00295ADD99|nr:piggyBac transposable element-derived protein 4-like [Ruditapes philippinarum]
MKKLECVFRRKNDLLVLKYFDKRAVHMISSIHEASMSVLNKVDQKTNNLVMKPTCVVDYCRLMGGVDLSDQIHQYYSCLRKTSKWYKKLFFHLLNLCVINAYLLYTKYSEDVNKLDHYRFRRALCESLLLEAPNAPKPSIFAGRRSTGEKPLRLTERHFPELIPAKPGTKKAQPSRDCSACNPPKKQRQGYKRKQTRFWCSECEKVLCVPNCFRVYHTLVHYKRVLQPDAAPGQDGDHAADSSSDSSQA